MVGAGIKHKGVSPERAHAAAMENADFAARGAQPALIIAMRENAATQREGMQQAGSTARAQMQEVGQNNRANSRRRPAQQKFGMEQETQGFSNRAAAQHRSSCATRSCRRKTRPSASLLCSGCVTWRTPVERNLRSNFMTRKVPVFDAKGIPLGERDEIVDLRTGLPSRQRLPQLKH